MSCQVCSHFTKLLIDLNNNLITKLYGYCSAIKYLIFQVRWVMLFGSCFERLIYINRHKKKVFIVDDMFWMENFLLQQKNIETNFCSSSCFSFQVVVFSFFLAILLFVQTPNCQFFLPLNLPILHLFSVFMRFLHHGKLKQKV